MNRAAELAALAEQESRTGRIIYDAWVPATVALKAKGFTYEEIHAWLKKHGENVPASAATFRKNMTKRYRRAVGAARASA